MLNLNRLHSHFIKGNVTHRMSGKTTAVIYQAIGFTEVLENTNIYIFCLHEDRDHIAHQLMRELHNNNCWALTGNKYEFYVDNRNVIKIKAFDKYMNNDFMNLNHQSNDHMILFDFRDITSVNTSAEAMYEVMGQTVGRVVGSAAYEVYKIFGKVNIEIN